MFELLKMSLDEITFVVCGYHVQKTFGKLKLVQICLLPESDDSKDRHAAVVL